MSIGAFSLTLSWRKPLSYRNQTIDLRNKSLDWFLYDNSLRHKRVDRVIIFLRLIILRYPMMALLVYNVLKFISSSMSRLRFVFLALLLIWLTTLSRCFLKFALKELILFTLGWKKVLLCKKLFGDIRELWLHVPMRLFSDPAALFHIVISEYPESNF